MEIAFPKNQTDKDKSEEDFLWKNERVEKWNEYVLYRITSYSTKRRRKRDHPYEKQVSKTTKENKNLQKGLYPHEDHIHGQRKMSKQTNDLSKPFQERKRHRGKEKNH